jgi:hypothetical protein
MQYIDDAGYAIVPRSLLEEIRALVAADALVPSSNTHYELRALLERNPA